MDFASRPLRRSIVVIDKQRDFSRALAVRLEAEGMMVEQFASIADASYRMHALIEAGCLILDADLPEASGLEFQRRLIESGVITPIIFVSGFQNVRTCVRAMKAGAVDFLCKPFDHDALVQSVGAALRVGDLRRRLDHEQASIGERYATLTDRQKEVMALVVNGLLSKQIAYQVGLSEITVKVHRSHLMRKMQARSVADLVYMADILSDKVRDQAARLGLPWMPADRSA